jgi:hypothetical protein
MLAHSPPLPLTIRYDTYRRMRAEDESGILLALSHCDRVRHISMENTDGKFVMVMDNQFPILERVSIHSWTRVAVDLPVEFQAPNLRHLTLWGASLPIGSPLLTTATGLVILELINILPSDFPPSYILTRLALMAMLERLSITSQFLIPSRDVESQLHQTLDTIILPNLRQFRFRGRATYLEGLVAWISAPSLSILRVNLLDQLPLTVSRLCQFMQSSESLTFRAVQVTFRTLSVSLHAVPWKWDTPFTLQIECGYLGWHVASTVQFFGTLSPVLSFVEQVAFSHDEQPRWLSIVDRSQWRELLWPFTNVKVIHMKDGLISKILHSLPSDDGEPLLPNIEEVGYFGGSDPRDAITTFINERQVSGHPVSLRRVDSRMFFLPGDL